MCEACFKQFSQDKSCRVCGKPFKERDTLEASLTRPCTKCLRFVMSSPCPHNTLLLTFCCQVHTSCDAPGSPPHGPYTCSWCIKGGDSTSQVDTQKPNPEKPKRKRTEEEKEEKVQTDEQSRKRSKLEGKDNRKDDRTKEAKSKPKVASS
jgi:hypothetical protein